MESDSSAVPAIVEATVDGAEKIEIGPEEVAPVDPLAQLFDAIVLGTGITEAIIAGCEVFMALSPVRSRLQFRFGMIST